jgi:nucleotide-binding universal stress UspA family protein
MTTMMPPVQEPTMDDTTTSHPLSTDVSDTTRASGPILLAIDGRPGNVSACQVASKLAARVGAEVRVLGVLEPLPSASFDVPVPVAPEVIDAMRTELQERVTAQVTAASPQGSTWPIEIREGSPPVAIAIRGRELGARAIVLGLGRHNLAHRLLGSETALRVLRLADVPMLAVQDQGAITPGRAVVGVDFSPASVRSAQITLSLFPDLIEIDLVHVAPPVGPAVVATPWESAYGVELSDAWPRFVEAIRAPSSVVLQTFTLKGYPAEALVARAAEVEADLVVVGSHGRGFISRLILGSVATGVLRTAHANVLAVPIIEARRE